MRQFHLFKKSASLYARGSPIVLANAHSSFPLSRYHATRNASGSSHHQSHHDHNESAKESFFSSSLFLVGAVAALGPGYYLLKPNKVSETKPNTPNTPAPPESPNPPAPATVDGLPFIQYVLIGAGTASYHAMLSIRKKDPSAKILLIGEEDVLPYSRPPLSKELWFSDTPETLKFTDWTGKEASLFYEEGEKSQFHIVKKNEFEKMGDVGSKKVLVLLGTKVSHIDVDKSIVSLNDGRKIKYGKVLIATGGTPRRLPLFDSLPKDAQSRVLTFRNVHDFKKLNELAHGKRTVAIVGGGFLGSELAVALAQRAKKEGLSVVQLFPEDGNMGLVFPRYLTKWTTQRLIQEGVDVRPGSEIEKATVSSNKKIQLVLKGDKAPVEADYVILAVGLNPNIDIAKKSGLEIDTQRNGVVVNAELESRSGVFVAGDVTSFHDVALGRRRVEHYDHAMASGKLAGLNMTGAQKPYTHQSMFWSDLGPQIAYEAVGILDSKLNTVGVWAKNNKSSEEDFGKGIVFYMTPQKRVVGILTWNVLGKMDLARQILRNSKDGTDVSELATLFDVNK